MTSDELKAAIAACTHERTWGVNPERQCLEMRQTLTAADGTVVYDETHNYLDDLKPVDLPVAPGTPASAAEGTDTMDHLTAELALPHHQDPANKHFGDAIRARIEELKAMGHTVSEAMKRATTPAAKIAVVAAKDAPPAHADAMQADADAAAGQVAAAGIDPNATTVAITGATIGAKNAKIG